MLDFNWDREISLKKTSRPKLFTKSKKSIKLHSLLLIINQIKLKTNLHKSDGQFSIEHENGLVVPRILAVQVDAVQDVLDQRVGDDRQQDSVLKTKDQLEKYQDKRQKF